MTTLPSQQQASLPTSISELILPFQPSLGQTLTSLKKSRLSVHNRLTSIEEDSAFVSAVAAANDLPLVANERCGSWYVDPAQKKGSVYFKSTDGHQGQWKFSLRRLNTSLLEVLGKHDGAIIVDSTRRGKSMPDALSKTVPIWVAVVNRVLFPEVYSMHRLSTPEEVVGRSEHAQIEIRIDDFVQDLLTLNLDIAKLKAQVSEPIHLEFITRQTPVLTVQKHPHAKTLICCSSSRLEQGDGDNYVQGAGDDTENWAAGLTAEIYWQHKDQLLHEPDEERLREMMQVFSKEDFAASSTSFAQLYVKEYPTSLFVGTIFAKQQVDIISFSGLILCEDSNSEPTTLQRLSQAGPHVLELGCSPGKLGGKALREKLPLLDGFVTDLICNNPDPKILILCSNSRDLSAGTALAILCRWIDDEGSYRSQPLEGVDKTFVRQRLACITDSIPDANPSRATLQSVNTYLMGHVN